MGPLAQMLSQLMSPCDSTTLMPSRPPTHRPLGYERTRTQARREVDQRRGSPASRGYDNRWREARAMFLSHHPLCVHCLSRGITQAATVVDHVTPHRGDQTLFWDQTNWQPLCERCHNRKTGAGL